MVQDFAHGQVDQSLNLLSPLNLAGDFRCGQLDRGSWLPEEEQIAVHCEFLLTRGIFTRARSDSTARRSDVSEPIISVSGLRGIVGESLTSELAARYVV